MPFWHRTTETWLVVGLGNPGTKYMHNHHNIGFMCADAFARAHNIDLERNRAGAKAGQGKIKGKDMVVAKPQTYMNLSGEAVGKLVRKHHIKPAKNLIVIHDDMDLPPGKLRIRQGGGSGGHNGIKSIAHNIGTEDFIRVRVGIGRPDGESNRGDVIDFVLGDFTPAEQHIIDRVIPAVVEALDMTIKEGVVAAMNRYNGTDFTGVSEKG